MIVTAWVLFSVFGLLAVLFLSKIVVSRINGAETLLFLLSVIVTAISAGIIFGGLVIL